MRVQCVEPPQTPPDRELCFPAERGKDDRKVVDVRDSTEQRYHQVFPRIGGNSLRSFGEDARQCLRLRSQNTPRVRTYAGVLRCAKIGHNICVVDRETLTQEIMRVLYV